MPTRYVTRADREWFEASVRGASMPGATPWPDGQCMSVRVYVVPGRLRVEFDGRKMTADDMYLIESGTERVETPLEDTEVLVTGQIHDPAALRNRYDRAGAARDDGSPRYFFTKMSRGRIARAPTLEPSTTCAMRKSTATLATA